MCVGQRCTDDLKLCSRSVAAGGSQGRESRLMYDGMVQVRMPTSLLFVSTTLIPYLKASECGNVTMCGRRKNPTTFNTVTDRQCATSL